MDLLSIIKHKIEAHGGREKLLKAMEIELARYDVPYMPRSRYVHSHHFRFFSQQEDDVIREFYGVLKYREIAEKINRSESSINSRVGLLKLSKYRKGIKNKVA